MTARRRGRASRSAVVVVLLLLASCSQRGSQRAQESTTTGATTTRPGATTTTATTAPNRSTLTWTPCDGGNECATLDVPIDYDKPGDGTLSLALVRQPARKPAERIGSLLMNPGGPGASAIDLVESSPLPAVLGDRFDLVGFDPRGVGRSTPLDCHSHLQEIYDADPTMEDAADVQHYLAVSRAFVDECEQKHKALLPHLGTVDVARDMDRVRAALGDEKLNYVGYSYGTSIGQQYARLFPTRVRAMVIDGVVDTSETGLQGAEGQAEGFSKALDAFIADCDANTCLGQPAGSVIDQVIAASEKQPIPAPGADRPATPGVVSLAIGQALYAEQQWPLLTRALQDGLAGDGTGLVRLADVYLQRNTDGSYSNGFEVYFGVSCTDATWPKDPQVILAAAKATGKKYPRVGEALVNDYVRCALWPVAPEPLVPIPTTIKGLPPIVVISTTNDPATPYASGVRVAEQVPDARLITNVGEGHTIFGQGKDCVDDAVDAYLIELKAPTDGLRCP